MDTRDAVTLMSVFLVLMSQLLSLMMQFDSVNMEMLLLLDAEFQQRQKIRREIFASIALAAPSRRRRRWWKRQRSQDWWNNIVPTFDDEQWLENFRLKKCTFDWICTQLDCVLRSHPHPVIPGQAIPTEKIVAIALYKLAHVAEYKIVGNQFGVHKSSVHNCVYAFCVAITKLLAKEYLRFPNEAEAKEIAKCFEEKTCIPQIIGAIDGSHIPITAPREGHTDFVNRKLYCSIVLQGIVDHQYLFRDISCKMPGASHDADVLRESYFYKNKETIMPQGSKTVDGMDIPYMILGDPAYPLQYWLLKNYTYDANITRERDSFNAHMNSGRVVVENAFGRLKGRWRVLLKQSDINFKFIPTVVAACCILHNICEMSREHFNTSWTRVVEEAELLFPQVDHDPYDYENQYDGESIRNHLCNYISQNFELMQSVRGKYAAM